MDVLCRFGRFGTGRTVVGSISSLSIAQCTASDPALQEIDGIMGGRARPPRSGPSTSRDGFHVGIDVLDAPVHLGRVGAAGSPDEGVQDPVARVQGVVVLAAVEDVPAVPVPVRTSSSGLSSVKVTLSLKALTSFRSPR